jgi:transposase
MDAPSLTPQIIPSADTRRRSSLGKSNRFGTENARKTRNGRKSISDSIAQSMLRSKKWSWLKAWAMQIAKRRGMKKAIVALARRLAVIMHRIWVDGSEFRWTREQAAAAAA